MHVPDQRAEDLAVSGFCLGAHQVDDMLCEVGVKLASVAVGAAAVGGMRAICAICSHGGLLVWKLFDRVVISEVDGMSHRENTKREREGGVEGFCSKTMMMKSLPTTKNTADYGWVFLSSTLDVFPQFLKLDKFVSVATHETATSIGNAGWADLLACHLVLLEKWLFVMRGYG